MKRTLAFVLTIVLAACSSTSFNPKHDGGAGSDGGGGDYYLPAGYTLTPFLATSATTHVFSGASQVIDATGKSYKAVLETDVGRMVIDLYATMTPITCNSFVFLALNHFFDGIAFHRVIDGFVAQGGDPLTLDGDMSIWGTGGPGYNFGLEIDSSLHYDGAGVVGMARSTSPDSNGSQFFITLAAAPSLDGMYTIFGRVSEGSQLLPMIVRGEPPATPTRMKQVYIVERPAP